VHDRTQLLDEIRGVLEGAGSRESKATQLAEAIRRAGNHRWVGIYEVNSEEIAVLGWSGSGAPTYPRFPVTQGPCGAAVRSGAAVVVGDVTKDPRYLATFGSTRSEMIVPVFAPGTQRVQGLIDVESERLNAFTDAERILLERCASLIAALWEA